MTTRRFELLTAAALCLGTACRDLRAQAVPYLGLSARAVATIALQPMDNEWIGCLIGAIQGEMARVDSIALLPIHAHSATQVVPAQGHHDVIGRVHNHPTGQNCWYAFPGTAVPSADGVSFARSPYPIDVIVCGQLRLVWVDRTSKERRSP